MMNINIPKITDKITIHIGFTKAASTSLQTFFQNMDCAYNINGLNACNYLVGRNPLLFSIEDAVAYFNDEIKHAKLSKKHPIISHERLSGNPHSGHYDIREIADRISIIFPNARIIICIREQISLISSIYKQYIRIGGIKKIQDYLLPIWDFRIPLFDWRNYEFHRIIKYYIDLFGNDNVKVVLVEDLHNSSLDFYRELSSYIGVDLHEKYIPQGILNPGIPDEEIEHQRIRNYFLSVPSSIRDRQPLENNKLLVLFDRIYLIPKFQKYNQSHTIRDEVLKLFQDKFTISNRITEQLINRNLSPLGYM